MKKTWTLLTTVLLLLSGRPGRAEEPPPTLVKALSARLDGCPAAQQCKAALACHGCKGKEPHPLVEWLTNRPLVRPTLCHKKQPCAACGVPPMYLFFLYPSCRSAYGPGCGACASTTAGAAAATLPTGYASGLVR
jgi:hypothetical protein